MEERIFEQLLETNKLILETLKKGSKELVKTKKENEFYKNKHNKVVTMRGRIDELTYEKMLEICKHEGITQSKLLRELIVTFVEDYEFED